MEILKRKIENTLTSFGFDNKLNIDICWFDKDKNSCKVTDPGNTGEKKFILSIKYNNKIHENVEVTNQKKNENEVVNNIEVSSHENV